jgi:uracil-DNA glycosylase family 4
MISKEEALKNLELEMARDSSLPLQTNLVFGEGNPDCEAMFIGEAPGYYEDLEKRPFVGRGGQLLNQALKSIGWQRENVYITNILKRRPPANRDPLPEEIEAYKPYLARQVEIINPKLIVALGRFAMNFFLPRAKIGRDQGKVFRVGRRLVVPILHPAAALRGSEAMNQFLDSFKKLPAILKQADALLASLPAADESNANQGSLPSQPRLF